MADEVAGLWVSLEGGGGSSVSVDQTDVAACFPRMAFEPRGGRFVFVSA